MSNLHATTLEVEHMPRLGLLDRVAECIRRRTGRVKRQPCCCSWAISAISRTASNSRDGWNRLREEVKTHEPLVGDSVPVGPRTDSEGN